MRCAALGLQGQPSTGCFVPVLAGAVRQFALRRFVLLGPAQETPPGTALGSLAGILGSFDTDPMANISRPINPSRFANGEHLREQSLAASAPNAETNPAIVVKWGLGYPPTSQ